MRARSACGALALAALGSVAWAADQPAPRGIYTSAQATEGAALYAQHCASCHGAAMGGQDVAPPLVGAGFLRTWGGKPVADLSMRIRTSMPLNAPGTLGTGDTSKLVAAILAANGYAAGETALPPSPAAQKAIVLGPQP